MKRAPSKRRAPGISALLKLLSAIPLKEVAKRLKRSPATVSAWKKKGPSAAAKQDIYRQSRARARALKASKERELQKLMRKKGGRIRDLERETKRQVKLADKARQKLERQAAAAAPLSLARHPGESIRAHIKRLRKLGIHADFIAAVVANDARFNPNADYKVLSKLLGLSFREAYSLSVSPPPLGQAA